MKLQISIEYKTAWGEELVLCLGGKRYPLTYVEDGLWRVEVPRVNPDKVSEYSYEVVSDGATVRTEWKKHVLEMPEGKEPKVLVVADRWLACPDDAPFYSSAFTGAIFARQETEKIAGGVKDAIKGFPKNVNVAVATALASDFADTEVRIRSVPGNHKSQSGTYE